MLILGRRNPLWLAIAACLLVSACGGGAGACSVGFGVDTPPAQSGGASVAPPADPTDPPARPKIVALGDSLTAGYGLVESESYPAILQARIDEEGYKFEVVNAGVSGDTSAGALRRLDWALDGDVKIMIVALGGNDGLRGLSVAEMEQNLTGIIERARERNVIVILAGMEAPPNYGLEYVQSFRAAFREVALQQRILFIPFLLDKVAGQGTLNQADGIHPNADGSRVVADTVWSVLKPVLDQLVASS
jgi:acyl-CoA thioesterase I